jgi:acyl carrier protein
LVLALESEFGIKIRDAEMVRLVSFDKLITHLSNSPRPSSGGGAAQ